MSSDGRQPRRSGAIELTFLGDALESFARALDPVLIIVALGRKQLHHLVAAGRSRAPESRRRVIDRFTDLVLVRLQLNLGYGRRLHRRALRAHDFDADAGTELRRYARRAHGRSTRGARHSSAGP